MTNETRLVTAFVLMLISYVGLSPRLAYAADSAVILMYHHVDWDTPQSTSVTPDRFAAHLDYLAQEGFRIRPLLEVLESVKTGSELAEKTVVLTFDDGYISVLENALPLLRDRNWPFTVFVSTEFVDKDYRAYLSWDQLRQLADNGGTIGNHSRTHTHLVRRADNESVQAWQQRVRDEIIDAGERIGAELGDAAIPVFAYPYGEYDTSVKEIVQQLGLFALGQHSGAVGLQSDLLAVPRFPIATGYDELDDFELRVHSRTLPALILGRESHILDAGESQPPLRLRITPGDFRADALVCYASNQGVMDLRSWTRDERLEVVARPVQPLRPGRTRVNCTAPSTTESGVYYWFGYLWMKKNSDGSWYAE